MAVKPRYVFGGDLCLDPQTLINNGRKPTPVITLTDHEAALAEKDKEIERLCAKVQELLRRKDLIERAYRGYGTPEEERAKSLSTPEVQAYQAQRKEQS